MMWFARVCVHVCVCVCGREHINKHEDDDGDDGEAHLDVIHVVGLAGRIFVLKRIAKTVTTTATETVTVTTTTTARTHWQI